MQSKPASFFPYCVMIHFCILDENFLLGCLNLWQIKTVKKTVSMPFPTFAKSYESFDQKYNLDSFTIFYSKDQLSKTQPLVFPLLRPLVYLLGLWRRRFVWLLLLNYHEESIAATASAASRLQAGQTATMLIK